MNTLKIETLIEKYFSGLTTLEEENSLKEYFSKDNIPNEFKQYQPLFRLLKDEKNIELDQINFDLTRNEKNYSNHLTKYSGTGNKLYYSISIAAIFIIFIGLGIYISSVKSEKIATIAENDIRISKPIEKQLQQFSVEKSTEHPIKIRTTKHKTHKLTSNEINELYKASDALALFSDKIERISSNFDKVEKIDKFLNKVRNLDILDNYSINVHNIIGG